MLELRDIKAQYGAVVALHEVSFAVNEGELVALLGSNGAGKTTTLSTISGTLRPSAGKIFLHGEEITGLRPERIVRRGIAMTPEDRGIFPDLTIEKNLRLGAYIRSNRSEYRNDLERMCEMFPILRERFYKPAGNLSGGEQQQLAIARALMSHPRLLLLDEPSLGLAPRLVTQVLSLIDQLNKEEGMTILLVEQNVTQTLRIVDRAYLLNMGRVEASGTPEEINTHVDLQDIYMGGNIQNQKQQQAKHR